MTRHLLSESLDLSQVAGAALLVIDGRGEAYHEFHGVADISIGAPISATSQFRLASVAKQFTSGCLIILRRQGLVDWQDSVRKYFPELPAVYDQVRVRHLINHTSGICDYEKLIGDDYVGQILDAGVVELLAKCEQVYFAPGAEFRYSNSGYAMLACLVERVSGMAYCDFLKANLVDGAGMETAVAWHPMETKHAVHERVMGYVVDGGTFALRDGSATSAVLGDGGIYCNVADYQKWILGLTAVFTTGELAEMFSPGRTNSGQSVPYGIGWRLENSEGRWLPYHPGSSTGFSHCVRYDPGNGAVVALFTNTTGAPAVAATATIRDSIARTI